MQSASFSAQKAPHTGLTGLLALFLLRAQGCSVRGICPLYCRKGGPALRQGISQSVASGRIAVCRHRLSLVVLAVDTADAVDAADR
ncbi:hypothetical protein CCMA1212_006678 [Trichoderma ghanense]|uniref:Secreted protein n=1 Tax=Trichoderma ghanense TaxID=65468 RepID=A0ABY2H029_9HYPO